MEGCRVGERGVGRVGSPIDARPSLPSSLFCSVLHAPLRMRWAGATLVEAAAGAVRRGMVPDGRMTRASYGQNKNKKKKSGRH